MVSMLALILFAVIELPETIRTDPVQQAIDQKVNALARGPSLTPHALKITYILKEPMFTVGFDEYYYDLSKIGLLKPLRPYIESKVNYRLDYNFEKCILAKLESKGVLQYTIMKREVAKAEMYSMPEVTYIEVDIVAEQSWHDDFQKKFPEMLSLKSEWTTSE